VPPTNYHLTLKYLGWTRHETIDALRDTVAEAIAGTQRLTFRTARLGAFPALDQAIVVWAGIDPSPAIQELHAKIEAATVAFGYPPETRPYVPHVTLGRLRETRPLKEVVLPLSEQMFSDTKVDAVSLFESQTKSSGSVYVEVAKIPFKTRPIPGSEGAERQTGAVSLGAPADEPDTDDGWPHSPGNRST
jgi:2'-5' RNA ligase